MPDRVPATSQSPNANCSACQRCAHGLDRPDKLNALSKEMWDGLAGAVIAPPAGPVYR